MRTLLPGLTALLLATACRGEVGDSDNPVASQVPPPTAIVSVSMLVTTAQIAVGETVQLRATPRTATGGAAGAQAIVWRSNAPAIASVDQNALAKGVGPGIAIITVNIDGHEAQATITVTAPGR
ncbi:MAG: Ig-like domain-containing protein [Gemmatimonadaceae bacterium]